MNRSAPKAVCVSRLFRIEVLVGGMAWALIYFDTAIPSSLRILLLVLIVTYVVTNLFVMFCARQSVRFNRSAVVVVGGALVFVVAQQINSSVRGIDFFASMPYLLIVVAIFPFSILAITMPDDALMVSFRMVSTLFSIAVISLGAAFYVNVDLFFDVLSRLDIDRGFFGAKKSVEGEDFANVYFPATLLLVPHCLYSLRHRSWIGFVLGILALFIAPSRFGVAVVAIFSIAILLFGSSGSPGVASAIQLGKKIFLLTIGLVFPIILLYFLSEFNLSDDGWSVRIAHLHAVVREFDANAGAIFFGFGAGSTFYTEGFGMFADNIEISQLEIIRKYGIVGFLFLTFVMVFVIADAVKRRGIESALALGGYYICALSNPVLLTLGSVLLCVSSFCSRSRKGM